MTNLRAAASLPSNVSYRSAAPVFAAGRVTLAAIEDLPLVENDRRLQPMVRDIGAELIHFDVSHRRQHGRERDAALW